MNKLILLMLVVLLAGCTQKYVSIVIHDGATLTVNGNIDPAFMREGTTETISPSLQLEGNMTKGEVQCNQCHAAYAGELFNTKLKEIIEKELDKKTEEKPTPIPPEPKPEPKPEPPPPVIKPDPKPPVIEPAPKPSPGPVPPIAKDFSNVTWLHTNVSSWKQTSVLRSVRVTAAHIVLDFDKTNVWPGRNHVGANVNANPWIFVYRNNRWYAATFEWMRVGKTAKGIYSVNGDHIKRSPLQDFVPVKGETYGFMVSGLARDATRNVQERTNLVMVKW